jgi:hypothetical protein
VIDELNNKEVVKITAIQGGIAQAERIIVIYHAEADFPFKSVWRCCDAQD